LRLAGKVFWAAAAYFYGSLLGSYFNMLVYRLPRGMSVWRPARSFCDHCGRTLGWLELVPVFGWLFLRGRSRCCGTTVPARYPMVELLAGVLAAVLAWALL